MAGPMFKFQSNRGNFLLEHLCKVWRLCSPLDIRQIIYLFPSSNSMAELQDMKTVDITMCCLSSTLLPTSLQQGQSRTTVVSTSNPLFILALRHFASTCVRSASCLFLQLLHLQFGSLLHALTVCM